MSDWVRRLVVVEDEPLVATLLSEVLRSAGFEVRSASNAIEAREVVDDFDPDGALIDVHLGAGPSGLHLGHALHRTHPHVGLIFLTQYQLPREAGWEVPHGSTFLSKDRFTDAGELVMAIESALRGASTPTDVRRTGQTAVLTMTQMEILRLAAQGLTNAAIAERRSTQERTVEQRLQSIYAALGIPTSGALNPRVEAVRIYIAEVGPPNDSHFPDEPQ